MRIYHDKGFDRATMSGDAWQCLKQMVGTTDGRKHRDYIVWERYFPQLTREGDARIRKAYSGGQNYSDNKGMNEGDLWHEDVHNMYGGVDYNDPLPVGTPVLCRKEPTFYKLYIRECRVKFHLKEGRKPVYQFKNGVDNILEGWEHGTLVTDTKEWHDLSMTNIDIGTYSMFYDLEFDPTYEDQYIAFDSRTGLLKPYLD